MTERKTPLGTVRIGTTEQLFAAKTELIRDLLINNNTERKNPRVALTGGSTPKAFYQWAVTTQALSVEECDALRWTVSDERCVPLNHEDSNFGTADRQFLEPIGVFLANKKPWPTDLRPEAAVAAYVQMLGAGRDATVYDLCFVGMGDDCHTLSLFPQCQLLEEDGGESFAAVEWPGRGWRLTLTPTGLYQCAQIVVLVTGAGKAEALHRVFHAEESIMDCPIQVLRKHSERVIWLVDTAAAAKL